jgi:hypothetical protein
MHDEIQQADDLLLLVKAGAECYECASEAIPAILLEPPQLITHDNSQWHSWPWKKSTAPRMLSGHFLRHDKARGFDSEWCENGEWFAFISGADYFSLNRNDFKIVQIGDEAEVPAILWRNVYDLVTALRTALAQPLSTHDCGGIVADWLGRYMDEYPQKNWLTPAEEAKNDEEFKRYFKRYTEEYFKNQKEENK